MNALKKITYNCRQATFLIEKKHIAGISLREQFELRYHLAGCSVCRLFQQQSQLIDRIVKNNYLSLRETLTLSDDFKEKIAKKIEDEIDKEI